MAKSPRFKPPVQRIHPAGTGLAAATSTVQAQVTHHRSGPLPDPQELAAYEQLHPGTAERIIRMAETEQETRHALETQRQKSDIDHRDDLVALQRDANRWSFRSDLIGQVFGAIIGITCILLAAYAGMHGQLALAGFLVAPPVVGIIQAIRGFRSSTEKPAKK